MFNTTPRRKQWTGNFPEEISNFLNPLVGRLDWMQDLFHNHFRVDIKEEGTEYILQAELPGVPKEQISIDVNNDYLTISIHQESKQTDEETNYIRKERRESYNQRSFYVGEVNPQNITATFKDGILEIRVPNINAKAGNSKNINIQ